MRTGYVASSVALCMLCSVGVHLCSNLLLWCAGEWQTVRFG